MLGQLCLDAAAQRNCYVFGTLTVPGDELSMITSVKKQDKIEIYHHLRVFLLEQEQSQFVIQLQKRMSYLVDKYPEYHQYFKTYYVPNIKEWATCFRVGTLVNT